MVSLYVLFYNDNFLENILTQVTIIVNSDCSLPNCWYIFLNFHVVFLFLMKITIEAPFGTY